MNLSIVNSDGYEGSLAMLLTKSVLSFRLILTSEIFVFTIDTMLLLMSNIPPVSLLFSVRLSLSIEVLSEEIYINEEISKLDHAES